MASASCAGPLPPLGSSPRAGSSAFETGRAMVAELPAVVERFGLAGSVDNPNDTSLGTTAAGVNLSIARPVFSIVGQCVHDAPFHGSKTLPTGRFATAGQGRRAPGYPRGELWPLSPGPRRERLRDGPLRRRKRKRQRFGSLSPSGYLFVSALPAGQFMRGWSQANYSSTVHRDRVVVLESYPPRPVSGARRR